MFPLSNKCQKHVRVSRPIRCSKNLEITNHSLDPDLKPRPLSPQAKRIANHHDPNIFVQNLCTNLCSNCCNAWNKDAQHCSARGKFKFSTLLSHDALSPMKFELLRLHYALWADISRGQMVAIQRSHLGHHCYSRNTFNKLTLSQTRPLPLHYIVIIVLAAWIPSIIFSY